jgi:hypothetical protein
VRLSAVLGLTLTFGTLMTCLTCAQRATLEAFSVEAQNKPGREWYCRWGACPAKEGGRMTYILFILAMGPMSATGIYNPQVVDRHHRCLAEPGSFEAIYCSTIAPTPHPRWAKKQAAR